MIVYRCSGCGLIEKDDSKFTKKPCTSCKKRYEGENVYDTICYRCGFMVRKINVKDE